jgi:hypothetical protein
MPPRQAQGWEWNRRRVRDLVRYIRLNMSCGQIAERFNRRFAQQFPGLALDKNYILKAVMGRGVIAMIVDLHGEEEKNRLIAMIRRPRGRPKGVKDKVKRKSPVRPRSSAKRPGKSASAAALMALRAQNKNPAQ